jgi:membrane-bound inhibitor of C-type lysozyme
MKQSLLLCSVLALVVFNGCSSDSEDRPTETRIYTCEGRVTLTVDPADDGLSARISFLDTVVDLEHEAVPDGVKYTDGVTACWIRANIAFIEVNGELVHQGCLLKK